MGRELSAYEVRCPRCDVSFPVGTRKCMHCGGPTGGHGRVQLLESMTPMEYASSDGSSDSTTSTDGARFEMPGGSTNDDESAELDQPVSIGRSLFRSFGGLIWIIVLIAFSLARNCGDK